MINLINLSLGHLQGSGSEGDVQNVGLVRSVIAWLKWSRVVEAAGKAGRRQGEGGGGVPRTCGQGATTRAAAGQETEVEGCDLAELTGWDQVAALAARVES